MDTWLYDMDPLAALSYEGSLDVLRRGIDNGYFEGLIQKYILDNPYYALISLVPEPGLTERHDKALADKLAAYKASLSKEEIDAIVADSRALQKRQATPDSPEALETIPTLTRDDLEKKADTIAMEQQDVGGVPVCYVPDETNGITYVNAYFDLHGLTREEISYVYLLSDLIGDMDTTDHTYGDIASLIDLYTGGIDYSVSAFSNRTDNKDYMPVFRFKAKGLTQNLDKLVDLLKEISLHTVFTNKDRLVELVEETKAGWDMDAFRRGHTIVMHRFASRSLLRRRGIVVLRIHYRCRQPRPYGRRSHRRQTRCGYEEDLHPFGPDPGSDGQPGRLADGEKHCVVVDHGPAAGRKAPGLVRFRPVPEE